MYSCMSKRLGFPAKHITFDEVMMTFYIKSKSNERKIHHAHKSSNRTYSNGGISQHFTVHIVKKTRTATEKEKLGQKTKQSTRFKSQFLNILPSIKRQCKIQDGGLLKNYLDLASTQSPRYPCTAKHLDISLA